jgi:hypothetical protein
MGFLQTVYGVFLRPISTFRDLNFNYSPAVLMQGLFALAMGIFISQSFELHDVVGSLLKWFCINSLIFLTAYVFIAEGKDYWKLISLMAFANLPVIFYAPLELLASANAFIAIFLKLAVEVWVFNLNLIALSTIFSIRRKRMILLYLAAALWIIFFVVNFVVEMTASIKELL